MSGWSAQGASPTSSNGAPGAQFYALDASDVSTKGRDKVMPVYFHWRDAPGALHLVDACACVHGVVPFFFSFFFLLHVKNWDSSQCAVY